MTRGAQKDVADLPATIQARVAKKALELANFPATSNVKALQGDLRGQHRARIGDYRIIFTVSGQRLTITRVVVRGGAYD
jgi:mRNA-degrading endonuclease RelE of RelBE toxin-antitoxin system